MLLDEAAEGAEKGLCATNCHVLCKWDQPFTVEQCRHPAYLRPEPQMREMPSLVFL